MAYDTYSTYAEYCHLHFKDLLRARFGEEPTTFPESSTYGSDGQVSITITDNKVANWTVTIRDDDNTFTFFTPYPRLHPPIYKITTVQSQRIITNSSHAKTNITNKLLEEDTVVCLTHSVIKHTKCMSIVVDDKIWLYRDMPDFQGNLYLSGINFDLKLYDDDIKALINNEN